MNLISAISRIFTQAKRSFSTLMRDFTAIIYTLVSGNIKTIALPDTFRQNTSSELITRKTTVELPQNSKLFLAKDETSPRLECNFAVKTDHDNSKLKNLQHVFIIY